MGYVGFANLPNQVHRKSVRKGFQFTAMVVGEFFFLLIVQVFRLNNDTPSRVATRPRRVWPWKVYSRQYPLQYHSIPS
jgi:hypothetical protein